MALEIPTPTTRHGWKLASRDLETYLASALKKKSVEVYEKNMDPGTKERFAAAKKGVEVKKFLASKALEALPPDKQPSKQEAMRMRRVLSWKTDHLLRQKREQSSWATRTRTTSTASHMRQPPLVTRDSSRFRWLRARTGTPGRATCQQPFYKTENAVTICTVYPLLSCAKGWEYQKKVWRDFVKLVTA